MSRFGVTDKPDANQARIVAELRALGWFVEIAKRPIDLYVIEPGGRFGFWVEVKSSRPYNLTPNEAKFFERCPMRFRMVAVTTDDVLGHAERWYSDRKD